MVVVELVVVLVHCSSIAAGGEQEEGKKEEQEQGKKKEQEDGENE